LSNGSSNENEILLFIRDATVSVEVNKVFDLSDKEWHHLVMVVDRTIDEMRLYGDGIQRGTTEDISSITGVIDPTQTLKIGERHGGSVQAFDGAIDDVRIYSRALATSSIERLYKLGKTTHIAKTITTNPDLSDGLVGHWTFDGPDLLQNAADTSGQGNTGYLSQFTSTTTTRGAIGQALDFDGTNDYVDMSAAGPSLAEIAGDKLTVGAWVKPNVVSGAQFVSVKNGPYQFYLNGDKLVGAIYNGTSWTYLTGTISIVANQWTYVAMIYDGSSIRVYVNGQFDSSTAKTGNLAGDGCSQIGRYTWRVSSWCSWCCQLF